MVVHRYDGSGDNDFASHTDTVVTFPRDELAGESTVIWAGECGPSLTVVLTEVTPFHPRDHRWPDQPGDRGSISVGGHTYTVRDSITVACDRSSGDLFVDTDIPVARGASGWTFFVAHVADFDGLTGAALTVLIGMTAVLSVDRWRRRQLSVAHTACHLAALALNWQCRPLWRKDTRHDSLGSPDFDQSAIVSSRIEITGARDEYRLGKSLRKSGFDTDAFRERLPGIMDAAQQQLDGWMRRGAAVRIEATGSELSAVRMWCCDLPEGSARLPCGGTHVTDLAEMESVVIATEVSADGSTVTLVTQSRPRG